MNKKQTNNTSRRLHDPFFRWLFADTRHLKSLLHLAQKVNDELRKFLEAVNLDTIVRIPDAYSEVDETGEADLAFRVHVSTGAPVLVGVLLEHKSGRDPDVLDQISRYVHSVMRGNNARCGFDRLPTMAIIFYNGRERWDPIKNIEKTYPKFFHGSVLPFRCAFVNMADIPISDCLACDDVATAMGVTAMKFAYDKNSLLTTLPKFKDTLEKVEYHEATCLLQKISVYLQEYVDQKVLEELDMAFMSIGQKYGFVSAGDIFRQKIAEAQKIVDEERLKADNEAKRANSESERANLAQQLADEERQKADADRIKSAEEKLNTARKMVRDGVLSVENAVSYFGLTKEQILES